MANEFPVDQAHYTKWMTLLGFFDEQEALGFIQHQGLAKFSMDEWLQVVQRAREAVSKIADRSNLQPEVSSLEEKYIERFRKLREDPTFQEHIQGMKSARFALVEIGKLRCFETQLNSEYLERLIAEAPAVGDEEGLLKYCLPLRDEKPKTEVLVGFNRATNSFIVSTDNLDLRVLGGAQSEDPASGRPILGFAFGLGLPQVTVVNYHEMFMLKNGYHRAFSLLKKGHERIPCLLLETDNLESIGAWQQPGFFPINLLISNKSPIVSDFLTGAAVSVTERRLRAVLSVHAEIQIVTT